MLKNKFDIGENLDQSIKDNFNNKAIYVDEKIYTYEQLYQKSTLVKSAILSIVNPSEQFVGILCYRSITPM